MGRKSRRKDVEGLSEPPSVPKKEKRKSASRHPSKIMAMFWWIATAATFSASIAGLVTLILKLYMRGGPDFEYALVVLPEPEVTAMVVYGWKGSKRDLLLREIYSRTYYGKFARNGVNNDFKVEFAKALAKIPRSWRSSSPVLFGGSSGMRILRSETASKWNQLIDVETFFKEKMKLLPKSVRNLDSYEEALYGWISINYLSDSMIKGRQPIKAKRDIFTTTNTLGSLDFGRDSFHISYEIPKKVDSIPVDPGYDNNTREITLYGRRYYIYTKSFICLGPYRFIARYLMYEAGPSAPKYVKNVPCFEVDSYSYAYMWYNVTCSVTEKIKNWVLEKHENGHFELYGSQNYDDCKKKVQELLKQETCKKTFLNQDLCEELKLPTRPYNITFLGFNEFSKWLDMARIEPGAPKEDWEKIIKNICTQGTRKWLEKNIPKVSGTDGVDRRNLCLILTYLYVLLTDQFNLTVDEWSKMRFQRDIDGTKIIWGLGYLTNVTKALPTESPFHDSFHLYDLLIHGAAYSVLFSISSVFATFALRNSMTLAMRPLNIPHSPDGSEMRVWTTSL